MGIETPDIVTGFLDENNEIQTFPPLPSLADWTLITCDRCGLLPHERVRDHKCITPEEILEWDREFNEARKITSRKERGR